MGKLVGFNPDISLFPFILNRRGGGEHGIFARVHRHLNRVRPTVDFCTDVSKKRPKAYHRQMSSFVVALLRQSYRSSLMSPQSCDLR